MGWSSDNTATRENYKLAIACQNVRHVLDESLAHIHRQVTLPPVPKQDRQP
jgi:hypothetical protein